MHVSIRLSVNGPLCGFISANGILFFFTPIAKLFIPIVDRCHAKRFHWHSFQQILDFRVLDQKEVIPFLRYLNYQLLSLCEHCSQDWIKFAEKRNITSMALTFLMQKDPNRFDDFFSWYSPQSMNQNKLVRISGHCEIETIRQKSQQTIEKSTRPHFFLVVCYVCESIILKIDKITSCKMKKFTETETCT